MVSSALRFFVIVCFGTIFCVPMVPVESVLAQERVNIFDNNRHVFQREAPRTADSERARQISDSFRMEFTHDPQQQGRALMNYGIFLGIVTVIFASFVAWQMWTRKRVERTLNDPMFLVYELNSAHQLSEQEKRLMLELSEKNLLSTPLKLFVEPKYLLDALENEKFVSSQPTVQILLFKLFDIAKA